MVVPVNILGLPSCAVPLGADDGLPQGVQLGAGFQEDFLLEAAPAIEDRGRPSRPLSLSMRAAARLHQDPSAARPRSPSAFGIRD
jgi:hypothetical protein